MILSSPTATLLGCVDKCTQPSSSRCSLTIYLTNDCAASSDQFKQLEKGNTLIYNLLMAFSNWMYLSNVTSKASSRE